MTAAIGLFNKKGIALAVDSAVTRVVGDITRKVTKNGNKLIRLSNVVPICAIITGNADFLQMPWDVIARKYRQDRGNIRHATVEVCTHDFFTYISRNDRLWNEQYASDRIKSELNRLFEMVLMELPYEICSRNCKGQLEKPKTFEKSFVRSLKAMRNRWQKDGLSPQFVNYTLEEFHNYSKDIIDDFINTHTCHTDDLFSLFDDDFPAEFFNNIRNDLEQSLMVWLSTRKMLDDSTNLVFTGYGIEQDYPSLISALVCEGFDHHINYHIRPDDIISITDNKPVAICSFAQDDVINSILNGAHEDWTNDVLRNLSDNIYPIEDTDSLDMTLLMPTIDSTDIETKLRRSLNHILEKNRKEWERALEKYDLKSMAMLASSLIELTEFHRILTFQQEGVGGTVDLAVITKNDGFNWLSRKSWYHHKDVNGEYGSMGI